MGIFTKAVTTLARSVTLTNPQLYSFFGGGPTSSGESVSVDSALQLDVVWSCARLVAGTVATLPCHVYTRDDKGRGTIAYEHPLYTVVHDIANTDMTAMVFWEALVAALMLWGNGYARIERSGPRVVALTPLRPDRISVRRETDGSLVYTYQSGLGPLEDIAEDDIMHVKGFSTDGMMGLSPVAQARETLGLAKATEKTVGSLFRNSMRPSAIVTTDAYLDPARRERFETEVMPKFAGAMQAGKIPVLEGGWKLEPFAMNPADAQLLATRQFSIEQICRWFGVPPAMIGHMDKSTAWGTGLEQMNLWFLTYTLRPILRAIEQELSRSVLLPVQRRKFYCEFNVEGLLRADSAGRAALMKVLAECGLRTHNELRALDNFPPLPGGDDLTVMSNMLPLQLLGKVAKLVADKPVPGADSFTPTPTSPAENQGTSNQTTSPG